jgi:hypothetical protein
MNEEEESKRYVEAYSFTEEQQRIIDQIVANKLQSKFPKRRWYDAFDTDSLVIYLALVLIVLITTVGAIIRGA